MISAVALLIIALPLLLALAREWGGLSIPYLKIIGLYNLFCLIPFLTIYSLIIRSLNLGKMQMYLIATAVGIILVWSGVLLFSALRGDFI